MTVQGCAPGEASALDLLGQPELVVLPLQGQLLLQVQQVGPRQCHHLGLHPTCC